MSLSSATWSSLLITYYHDNDNDHQYGYNDDHWWRWWWWWWSDMIFVKTFTRPLFREQEFYAKNAWIATLPNLQQKSVNAFKWLNSRQTSIIKTVLMHQNNMLMMLWRLYFCRSNHFCSAEEGKVRFFLLQPGYHQIVSHELT